MSSDIKKTSPSLASFTSPLSAEILAVQVQVNEVDHSHATSAAPERGLASQGWLIQLIVLVAVLVVAGFYVGSHIGKGWVPADEGTLGQSALRVWQGQLPHRDFGEIYTGGLSVIHALAFRVLGVNLLTLRICVFLFFLAWIPAVYYVAFRFVSALGAGLMTLVAVSWSFPNYPAAMPSWYNLFFATFGAAALLRYLEIRKRRWIFIAGVCGGISILIKVIGAYYIAGVLLSLAFVEQGEHESGKSEEPAVSYRIFSASALLLFAVTVIYMFHSRLGGGELYQFVLPPLALVGLILLTELGVQSSGTGARFRALFGLIAPFAAGVLTPVIAFLVPYAWSGSLGKFLLGVSSSAISRAVGLGVIRPAGVEKSVYSLALLGLVAAAMYLREFQGRIVGAVAAAGLAAMLLKSNQMVVSGVWLSVATMTPLVVLSGAALLAYGRHGVWTRLQRQRVMVLASLAALCSMVQYPFAAPIYLTYSVPLTLLATVAIVATARKRAGTYVLASLAGFYLIFGVVTLVPDYIYELTHKVGVMQELRLERAGGLQIEFAPDVEALTRFLQQHSPNRLMYAGNDCPELYFLAGLKNVASDDGGAPPDEVLKVLQSDDLNVVVINEGPFFPSARMSPEIRAEVTKRFPHSALFGIFHVFWKQ